MGKGSKRRGETAGRRKAKTSSEGQAERLLEEAEEKIAEQEYEAGLALLREAHALAPAHVQVAETLGGVLAETGAAEEAVAVLRTAVALSPNAGFEKYMYLGQLLSGAEGIQHLRQGVALLDEAAAAGGSPAEVEELNGLLAGALCSLAEGLIGEAAPAVDTVAEEARALLARASKLTPNSPEPLQALAGLLAEQGHADEALTLLHQSLALWLPPAADAADAERDERCLDPPSLEFRFDTAKLLLDLDHSTDTAVRVLEARALRQQAGLLEECDDRPDVWHLLALAHHGACSFERARNCVDEAEELLGTLPATDRDWLASELVQLRTAIDTSQAAWVEDCGDGADADEEEDEAEPADVD